MKGHQTEIKGFFWNLVPGLHAATHSFRFGVLSAAMGRSLLLALSLAPGAGMALQDPAQTPVPLSYFGLHAHRLVVPNPLAPTAQQISPWPTFSFGSLRLWDAYVAWPNLQPQRDVWDFTLLDRYVQDAEQRGISVLLPLGLSPAWASARPEEKSNYGPGNAAEPANMDDWRLYVRTVAQRYAGRIRFYELWNEINLKGFYSGSLSAMVDMARIAHEEVKRVDPGAQIVTPSITEARSTDWLDRYLALGGGHYADVVGYHFYTPRQVPEAMVPIIQTVKTIMTKHGVGGKPLWNTEAGWWIANTAATPNTGGVGKDWKKLADAEAAAYVARALLVGWASGLERYYWYAWDNVQMGIYDTVAQQHKPAANAYSRVVSWMNRRTVSHCTSANGVWLCELIQTDGTVQRIAWREDGPSQLWRIPEAWNANTLESLEGKTEKSEGSVLLGNSPVLIR